MCLIRVTGYIYINIYIYIHKYVYEVCEQLFNRCVPKITIPGWNRETALVLPPCLLWSKCRTSTILAEKCVNKFQKEDTTSAIPSEKWYLPFQDCKRFTNTTKSKCMFDCSGCLAMGLASLRDSRLSGFLAGAGVRITLTYRTGRLPINWCSTAGCDDKKCSA